MISFHCYKCKLKFLAAHFNPSRITINCPICEAPNKIDQSLTRSYGKTIGLQITKIMTALETVCARSKENLSASIDASYARIVNLCQMEEA